MKDETWEVLDGVHPGGGIGIGPVREDIGGPHTIVTYNGGDSEARAARIVACVNGCKSINPGSISEIMWALHVIVSGNIDRDECREIAEAAIAKANGSDA